MKRGLLSALVATSIVATGCTITFGHPPVTSDNPATGNQPIPSPSPQATGLPGAPGRIAVLDEAGTLTALDVANCDNLQTIPKAVIGPRPIGTLSAPGLVTLDRALRYALGIRV